MFGLGVPELIVILVLALLVLGPRKLPELGSFLGKSLRDFRDSLDGRNDDAPVPPARREDTASVNEESDLHADAHTDDPSGRRTGGPRAD